MNRPSLVLISALALAATSCGPPPPSDGGIDAGDLDGTVPGVTVSLGTGQNDYEDIARVNGRVELIYGAQGGYHVWGRARFRGFAPDVDVSFQAERVDTGQVLHMPQPARRWIQDGVRRGLLDLGGGEFMTDAELVILNLACSSDLVGRQLRLRLFLRERATGRTVTDERIATVVDEVPSPPCGMTPR
jgi:predicted transcriptional regulator